MSVVVGRQDFAGGDQCLDLILGELADFLTLAGEGDNHGVGAGSLESGWWMINSKVG